MTLLDTARLTDAKPDFAGAWAAHAEQYQNDLCLWAEEQWIVRDTGKLIHLEAHQQEILSLFFTRGSDGRFPWQTYLWSEPKKSGKTEIGGLVGLWVASTEQGVPEVYALANDREQSRARGFNAMSLAIKKNDVMAAELKTRKDRIEFPDGAFIETVPIDYAGGAGAAPVLSLWDELWAYTSERALRLWDEFTPVPTRLNSIRLITTYAGFRNESKLLWDLYTKTVRRGRRIHKTLEIYESKDGSVVAYWSHTPRMPWQTERYYAQQREQLRPSAYRRLHRNEWVKAETAFIAPEQWDALPAIPMPEPSKSYPVYASVDAAHKRDCTAVTAVGFRDGAPFLVRHRIWTPTPGSPVIPEETAAPYLRKLHKDFRLKRVRYDPAHFETAAIRLGRAGLPMQEYTQTADHLTRMGTALFDVIRYQRLGIYPAPDLRGHVLNAAAKETARGWQLIKQSETQKIDAAISLGMSVQAAEEFGPVDSHRGAGIYIIRGLGTGDGDESE